MVRIVGKLNRSPYILDPVEALRVGRRVDRLLSGARIPHARGVFRASAETLNEMDADRQRQAAARVAAGHRNG